MGPIAFPFQGIGLSGQSDAVIASQAIATKRDRKLKGCSDEGGLLTQNLWSAPPLQGEPAA